MSALTARQRVAGGVAIGFVLALVLLWVINRDSGSDVRLQTPTADVVDTSTTTTLIEVAPVETVVATVPPAAPAPSHGPMPSTTVAAVVSPVTVEQPPETSAAPTTEPVTAPPGPQTTFPCGSYCPP